MNNYKFGLFAEQVNTQNASDFDVTGFNPYSSAYFNDPQHMSECKYEGRITSIPSPYARMHITDLAFKEANYGNATMINGKLQRRALSDDYNKAMSHCLDIYELLFHADELNLKEKGITLHKLDLISTRNNDPNEQGLFQDANGNPTPLKSYIETLDLFRSEYVNTLKTIADRNNINNHFDFTSLYILKHNGKTFASTSPFTGFYAKADCDLSELGLEVDSNTHHKLLTGNKKDWTGLSSRSQAFQDFLYLLLRDTGLQYIFESLFETVKLSVDDRINSLNNIKITDPKYRKFNINTNNTALPLQKVSDKDLYLRPDGLDCSYIKYLLYLDKPVDLTITEEDCKVLPIEHRRFPADSPETCPWIGVNDILSDGLFILTYDVNDHYITIPYKDLTDGNQIKNRCLIPIKELALKYFKLEELVDLITITKVGNGKYSVSLKMPLQGGGETILRREYFAGAEPEFPNGIVIEGEQMRPFAFGIYPFIKATNAKNIYKILFYNSFESEYGLKFYKTDHEGQIAEILPTEQVSNKTNEIENEEMPVNCEYHQVSVDNGLAYAQVTLRLQSGMEIGSFIMPRLITPKVIPGRVNVAIDLGTSNTYMAYEYVAIGVQQQIQTINTHHEGGKSPWNELTFMNKRCSEQENAQAPKQNREDLYLRVSDRNTAPSDEWLSTQLNEFIPSRIDDEGYRFPIPTVINFLRQNGKRENVQGNTHLNPLINTAIPFAYYERGIRKGAQPYYYDRINNGGDFKWFCEKDVNGNVRLKENGFYKECFKAFVNELLFIVRSHLLSCGYNLNECSLIWSYPLAFADFLVGEYKQIWGEAYQQFIYKCDDPYAQDPQLGETGGYRVAYTNESRSPIFDCMDNPATSHHLTLLMDIGGGSTDIIGYKADSNGKVKPRFITSFGFAGNALYLGSSMNQIDKTNLQRTLFFKKIKDQPLLKGNKQESHQFGVYRISDNDVETISELMNYGFTKDPNNFRNIFRDNDANLVLKLHNAAITYHVAQLCCIYSPKEAPIQIYLTGNGSKLFSLNPDKDSNIKEIFRYVYEKHGGEQSADAASKISSMVITNPSSPKAATVNGALKGLSKGIELNEASKAGRVVMIGDASTAKELLPDDGGADVGKDFDVTGKVLPNVKEFIEMFYSKIYTTKNPKIKKEQMLQMLDNVDGNYALRVPQSGLLSDSLFFQYVALLLEQVSLSI